MIIDGYPRRGLQLLANLGDGKDISGNGNHGTFVSTTTIADHAGRADKGTALDGIAGYISFPSINPTALTVLFSLKKTANTNSNYIVTKWAGGTGTRSWAIQHSSTRWITYLSTDGEGFTKDYRPTTTYMAGAAQVTPSAYELRGFSFSANSLKIIRNGVTDIPIQKITDNECNTLFESASPIVIGGYLEGATLTNPSAQNNDIIMIYDRVLNTTEINKIYNLWRGH